MEAAVTNNNKRHAAVVGAGISGLVSARKLIAAGYDVDIYEASNRAGGKIASAALGDKTVNMGAEFVDTDHKAMRQLCDELGIKLTEATDQKKAGYVTPEGKRVSENDFMRAVQPLQKSIIADKEAIARDQEGMLARKIDYMSIGQYLQQKSAELDGGPQSVLSRIGGWFKKLANAATPWRHNISQDDAVKMVTNMYVAEALRDEKNISALQFVNEVSGKTDQFLAADCAFRVEGGTERIIRALQKDLETKGARFHWNAEAQGISKQDGKFQLTYKDNSPEGGGKLVTQDADNMVMALTTSRLAKIDGLQELGLSQQSLDTLKTAQYTYTAKFSVPMKGDGNNENWYSNEGLQAWRSEPGVMTFLVGGETLNQMKGGELVQHCLDNYAKAQGTTADKLFDTSRVAYSGVNAASPCYLSPAPGQVVRMAALTRDIDKMAESGIGIAGTFVPKREAGAACVGFMECGVKSADRAIALMTGKDKDITPDAPALSPTQWRDTVRPQQRAAAPQLSAVR